MATKAQLVLGLIPLFFSFAYAFHQLATFTLPRQTQPWFTDRHRQVLLAQRLHPFGPCQHAPNVFVPHFAVGSRFGVALQCEDKGKGRIGSVAEQITQDETKQSPREIYGRRDLKVDSHEEHQQQVTEHAPGEEGGDEEDDLGHLLEDIQEDIETIDDMTVQNDVSILICYSLSQAVLEIISQGPKETPGITMEDLVMIGRYFTEAASLGGAWVVAGFLSSHFRRKSRSLLVVTEGDLRVVLLTWLLAVPLVQVMRALGGADVGGFEGGRDTAAMLVLMLLWRCIEPLLYS